MRQKTRAIVRSDPDLQIPEPGPQNWPALHCLQRMGRGHSASSSGHHQPPILGWRGRRKQSKGAVTGAVGVRAVRAGFAGAVVGFEEAWVAGRALGLHTRGGQLH